ncbi:MAG: Imidazolonepropionase, partial [Dactylosporangium sp.]|nr:Imidazolonepropionase [Dactylosporangium sp.]
MVVDHNDGSVDRRKVLLIRAARLIDGSGAPAVVDPVVVVEGGLITGIFQGQIPDGAVPADAQVIDLAGHTLLPGLIDCHVHLNFPGDGTSLEDWMTESDGVLQTFSTFAAQTALRGGITTIRDTGSRGNTTFDLRRAAELSNTPAPRMLLCGQPVTMTGGHTWPLGGEADGVEGVRRRVRQLAKDGADWIKVMATGGGTRNTMSWKASYSVAELRAIVDEAHSLSRKVTIHCLSARGIEGAINAGADQIEHGSFFVDGAGHQEFEPAVAEKMATSGIAVTPTLSVRAFVVKMIESETDRSPKRQAELDQWRRMLDGGLAQFRLMQQMGINFVAGTDAGWMFSPFNALAEEMALMNEGGIAALDVIAAATGKAASVLGIADRVGQVAVGMEA